VVVAGAGGFIGGHLTRRLIAEGYAVSGYDIKPFDEWHQLVHGADLRDHFDLSDPSATAVATRGADTVFNLAADMGGMGFIAGHKLECMLSVLVSTNLLKSAVENGVSRFFFASSACVYRADRQEVTDLDPLREEDAYPAMPEDGYGWEKLFTERLCQHYTEETEIETRIGRLHNVYGPQGTWTGGREKSIAALCRKVAEAKLAGTRELEIWGDGHQTRTYCYVDDAVEGILRLTASNFADPVNIGTDELVSILTLADLIEASAGTHLERRHNLSMPQGVRGRSSDNTLVRKVLDWEPSTPLAEGLEWTYRWVEEQVVAARRS
jgi:GDP-D-mannose 3', 5'-epimerase